jgi:hypothetical protein
MVLGSRQVSRNPLRGENMRVRGFSPFGVALVSVGLVLGVSAAVAQQETTSDAQIESNVLKALASAPELSTQNIQTSTVYGVVTLSGNVHDEAMRTKAENLTARAQCVKKVVDELSLGDTPVAAAQAPPVLPEGQLPPDQQAGPPAGQVLQSDGTYAPAPPDQSEPTPTPGTPAQVQNALPPPPPNGRQPMYPQGYAPGPNGPRGGQQAGMQVTIPPGSVLQVRINRGIDSQHIKPGTPFDGTMMNDVVAGGAVAIPRGTPVQGVVVDSKKTGALKGEGELSLQVNSVTLGGQVYPVSTDVWQRTGPDKTASTVNHAIGLGILGAVVGAVADGGKGAAIGAGVGAGAGVATSAASPHGEIIIRPESVVTFRTAQPTTIATVSQQEMDRLNYAAGPPQGQPMPRARYYSPYYGYYYGPAYYPR